MDSGHAHFPFVILCYILSTATYLLGAAVSFVPRTIPLPTPLQYMVPPQIFTQAFSGLSALLSESTFAEATKQRTSYNDQSEVICSHIITGTSNQRGGISDGAN